MNLRKRAISGIMLAGSMVVMCAIADAASTVSAEAVAVVADTRTDLATDGTAGVVAQLNQINTDIVEMAAAGIACNVHYKPLPMLSAYRNLGFNISDFPNAYQYYIEEVTLPLHTKLSDEEVEYIIETFKEIVKDATS